MFKFKVVGFQALGCVVSVTVQENEYEEVDEDEEEEDDRDHKPFASLFSRLKPLSLESAAPSASHNTAPAPKRASNAESKAAKGGEKSAGGGGGGSTSNRKKKRPVAAADAIEPPAGPSKLAKVSVDDQEIIDKYMSVVKELEKMDPCSAEDAEFGQWAKDKVQAISDAKRDITSKKKSLKRRKDQDSERVNQVLDECFSALSKCLELVRKLSNGVPEGRQTYDLLMGMPHVNATTAVWMRALRAVAFDNLKLAQWHLFSLTRLTCA